MTAMIGNHTNFHTHLDNLIGFAQKMSPHSRTALIKEILTYYPLKSIFSNEPSTSPHYPINLVRRLLQSGPVEQGSSQEIQRLVKSCLNPSLKDV